MAKWDLLHKTKYCGESTPNIPICGELTEDSVAAISGHMLNDHVHNGSFICGELCHSYD